MIRKRKPIPAKKVFAEARKRPGYADAYKALDDEFSLLAEMIKARMHAELTQDELARRMKTTQAAVARLENGGTRPSTRTLERFAKATGHKLRITFVPN